MLCVPCLPPGFSVRGCAWNPWQNVPEPRCEWWAARIDLAPAEQPQLGRRCEWSKGGRCGWRDRVCMGHQSIRGRTGRGRNATKSAEKKKSKD